MQQVEIQSGQAYINKATNRVVRVASVDGTSVRFHDIGDDSYPFVESLSYFRNDFRLSQAA